MNLTFAGCGFLGIYHVGVSVCFKKYAPHLLLEKIAGASVGSLSACCLLCDLPLGQMTNDFFRIVNEARSHSLGPFSPSFNIQTCLFEGLQKHLPDDAHIRVNGRLHISLTRVYDGKNVIVSQFDSREDLLQALLCACFIPGFSGILPPRFHGVRYMDGAFSNNLPILDENTITVSPFCGESDICPRDQSSQLFHLNVANTSIEISRQNINRFIRILLPPRPEYLSNLCQQGFDDALQFLQRNNLINCRRCVAIQSTFVVSETVTTEQQQDYDPECRECQKHRTDASIGNMPETVVDVIQGYIDSANKGLANWLFKNKSFKILSLPATVPADLLLATINKIKILTPQIFHQIKHFIKLLLMYLNELLTSKILNKILHLDLESFDCIAGIQTNGFFDSMNNSLPYEELSKKNVLRRGESIFGDDTFDQILKVTTHQDALYAYYYTDEKNKMKITEIFDMTETELPPELNVFDGSIEPNGENLQIENDWNGIESDLYFGNNYNGIYDSGIIETNNNNILPSPNHHHYHRHHHHHHHHHHHSHHHQHQQHEQTFDYANSDSDISNSRKSSCSNNNGIQIEEITSDYSDAEADHYVTASERVKNKGYVPVPGQQQQQQQEQQQQQQISIEIKN